MSRVQTISRVLPLTPEQLNQDTPTGPTGEQAFTVNRPAPAAQPAGLAEAHVFPIIRGILKADPPVVPEFECAVALSIKVRFTATAGDGIATLTLHCFDPEGDRGNGAFYKPAEMTAVNIPTGVAGAAFYLRVPKGTTHCAFEVGGLADNDDIKIMVKPDNE